ncbi:MAG: penicillin-binding transpeptidase domain-containing protein [Eubacteriales bacterium]|nr:penicillin-binding transpeptidase domain-containing protein [Eubacteriales bacterium]
MRRFLKLFCVSIICLMILCGYSKEQKIEVKKEPEQIAQLEISNKAEQIETQNVIEESVDLSSDFDGTNGCAVLYSPSENKVSFYNKDMAQQEASPYSTFKIVSALSGLHNGIIKDETSTMDYNGTEYPNPDWNGNLTLQDAFQTSCIWYFRQVIDAVGQDELNKELGGLKYGNCDISEWDGSNINPYKELNGFWLDSSLKISPHEQVQVLSKLFEGQSIFSCDDIEILERIMLVQDNGIQQVYGKTGSGPDGEAWFVGYSEKDGQREYFAVYLNDHLHKEHITGSAAKEIALNIVDDSQL